MGYLTPIVCGLFLAALILSGLRKLKQRERSCLSSEATGVNRWCPPRPGSLQGDQGGMGWAHVISDPGALSSHLFSLLVFFKGVDENQAVLVCLFVYGYN